MKSFNQFCTEAYEAKQLTEGPLQFMGNLTGITPLVKGVQQFAKTPRASSVSLGKGLASMEVKSRVARELTKPVKTITGNNPVVNRALDIGADYVAPFVPTPKAIKKPIVKVAQRYGPQVAKAVTTQGPQLAKTFGKNLLVRGPQTALQGLATLAGVGSRLK